MVLCANDVVLRGVIIKHTLAAADACIASWAVHNSIGIRRIGFDCLPSQVVIALIKMIDQVGLQIHKLC